jgi:hypothetical protein
MTSCLPYWLRKLEGFKGSGQMYNAIPLEVDANAASARFAAARYGEEVARDLADPSSEAGIKEGVLFRSLTPPAPIEGLPIRTLAFLFQLSDLCELCAQRAAKPFTELLENAWPGMGAAWEALNDLEIEPPK